MRQHGLMPTRPHTPMIVDRRIATAALALALLLCGGPAASQTVSADRILGCYDLEMGPWNATESARSDSLWWTPPPRVEFTSREPRMARGYALQPAPNSLPTPHPRTAWTLTDSGFVRVHWGNGLTGMSGELEVSGDSLHGRLHRYYDVIPSPDYDASLTAVRVDCDAPPEFPFESQRFLIRTIELAGGFTISLGEPVRPRDEILGDFNTTAYFVERPSVGLLGGSRDVRVRVSEGDTAVSVRLTFASDEFAELKRRIVGAIGPPNGPDSPDLPGDRLRWSNRMTLMWLHRRSTSSGDDQVELTITDPRLRYRIPEEERSY